MGYGLEGLAGLSDNARLVQAPVPGALGDGLLSEAPRGFGGARLELLAPDIEPDAGGDWLWLTGAAALDVGLAFVPGSGLGDVFQSYQSGNYLMAGLLLSLELPGGKVFKGTFTILGKLAPVVGGATRGAGGYFEVLTESAISGSSRAAHRASANKGLAQQLRTDTDFAAGMNKQLGTDVLRHMESGKSGLRNPPGTEWHHPKTSSDSMWLLRRETHRDSALQDYLHQGNTGGFRDYYGQ